MLSKVSKHKDWYAIAQAHSDTLKSSHDAVNFLVGINKGSHQKFIFKEEGFYKLSENKFPLKITRYMVSKIDGNMMAIYHYIFYFTFNIAKISTAMQ